jgi:hypothetical protein
MHMLNRSYHRRFLCPNTNITLLLLFNIETAMADYLQIKIFGRRSCSGSIIDDRAYVESNVVSPIPITIIFSDNNHLTLVCLCSTKPKSKALVPMSSQTCAYVLQSSVPWIRTGVSNALWRVILFSCW